MYQEGFQHDCDNMNHLKKMRVDHIGSLLRPQSLIDAFLESGRGEIDSSELEGLQDDAIREVVRKQEAAGLPVITDGEYRRLNWQVSFSRVGGWDQWQNAWNAFMANPMAMFAGEKPGTRGADAVEKFKSPASARLSLEENFPLQEFRFLRSTTGKPAKAMLMGPDRVSQMCDTGRSIEQYRDTDRFLADVVHVQKRMVSELVEAGCKYVQLDEPSYTGYVDRETLARIAARGEDPMKNLARAVDASNAVIEGMSGSTCFGLHICRGNRASMWHREGSYDGIAEFLFESLKFDRLLLEYDSERAGGFEPLRFVPKNGPTVVLGLITTKSGELETADDLLRRIEDAQQYIDIDQLAISPQCGFASGIGGNHLSEQQQWQKLELMLEVAGKVWGLS